ncbi:hypothetical protein UO65_2868 [Actinokineospora spheciospongiae]|uniref:Uncharacterized protein n=1 Tax=Actinokineospora spheciospongiae TaxID=909613 RepID=W7J6Y2_9PSEU|nr:hypothetical protein [Actinokineospora spheciospongiae]EWC61809.1 hypothetical protein UO65_2868 [Actinokineospora spheciospongiae]
MIGNRVARGVAKVAGVALTAAAALVVGPQAASAQVAAQAPAVACQAVGRVSGSVAEYTLYDDAGYSGACITFYRLGNCTATTGDVNGLYNLAGWGWDNRAGSVHTYSQCDVMVYDARDCPRGGAHSTWVDQSADLRLGGVNWQNRATCVLVS